MRLRHKYPTWVKILLIILLIRLVAGAVFYYVIVYRFEDVVQLVIDKESNGAYRFDAADVDVSLWKSSIVMRKAKLRCLDTNHVKYRYDIDVPRLFLRIRSWRGLLLDDNVYVDSISIQQPDVRVRAYNIDKALPDTATFNPALVFDMFRELAERLQIRSLHLKDGMFTYNGAQAGTPFKAGHIDLLVSNFSPQSGKAGKLFSSANVELSVDGQHCTMPDGLHQVDFSRLHFSTRDQYFELDSFQLNKAGDSTQLLLLSADKLFFNSERLSALYNREELLLDTLILERPVLNLQSSDVQRDSSGLLTQAMREVFTGVNVQYIDVRGGQFLFNSRNRQKATYSTRKLDLSIYNLWVEEGDKTPTTDSVRLKLSGLKFTTPDSLYEIRIGELVLNQQNARFRNAVFGPSANNQDNTLSFEAPLLELHSISIDDLLDKKIQAGSASLTSPVISLVSRRNMLPGQRVTETHMRHFYRALHGLRELVAVDTFNIENGSIRYQSAGKKQFKLQMGEINTCILLDHFLTSDSLIDIKQSFPILEVGTVRMQTGRWQLQMDQYHFDGPARQNYVDQFVFTPADSSLVLQGKAASWQRLDWDLLQKSKILKVDSLVVQHLQVTGHARQKKSRAPGATPFPDIQVGYWAISQLDYQGRFAGGGLLSCRGHIAVSSTVTAGNYFKWGKVDGWLQAVQFSNGATLLKADTVYLDNEKEIRARSVLANFETATARAEVWAPEVKVATTFHSGRFTTLELDSLLIRSPTVNIVQHPRLPDTAVHSPGLNFPMSIRQTRVENASLRFTGNIAGRSARVSGQVNLLINNLAATGKDEHSFKFDHFALKVNRFWFNHPVLSVEMPATQVVLDKGVLTAGALSAAELDWTGDQLQVTDPDKKKLLTIGYMDARWPSCKLAWQAPALWPAILQEVVLSPKNIVYNNGRLKASVGAFKWDPFHETIAAYNFEIAPALSMRETWIKSWWQTDYLTATGKSAVATGAHLQLSQRDTSFFAHKLLLDNVSMLAARDKRRPFNHGSEQDMPARLLSALHTPFGVDSVVLKDCAVDVRETSSATNKMADIPLQKLSGVITRFTSQPRPGDSLRVLVSGEVLDSRIRRFYYSEAYGDSLSGFQVHLNVSAMSLPSFSEVIEPLAAIRLERGQADTLYAEWTGNKYAATGLMHFYYHDLNVQLVNVKDSVKKQLLLSVGSWLVNGLVINKKNKRPADIFFVRDRERFVFNYWVKTLLKGVLASAGIKRAKKEEKAYEELQQQYHLPAIDARRSRRR